jgi:hypothetical protein
MVRFENRPWIIYTIRVSLKSCSSRCYLLPVMDHSRGDLLSYYISQSELDSSQQVSTCVRVLMLGSLVLNFVTVIT